MPTLPELSTFDGCCRSSEQRRFKLTGSFPIQGRSYHVACSPARFCRSQAVEIPARRHTTLLQLRYQKLPHCAVTPITSNHQFLSSRKQNGPATRPS